jgi:hypothetical protein
MAAVLENLPRIARVETPQGLAFLISIHGVRNGWIPNTGREAPDREHSSLSLVRWRHYENRQRIPQEDWVWFLVDSVTPKA